MKDTKLPRELTHDEIESVNGAGLLGNVITGLNGTVNSLQALPKDVIENAYDISRGQLANVIKEIV